MVGRDLSVLIEKSGRFDGQMVGKSEYLHAVHVADADIASGDLRKVRIKSSGANSLGGELVSAATWFLNCVTAREKYWAACSTSKDVKALSAWTMH